MSNNRKNSMIYFAAAIFLTIAAYLNIKTRDYVFVAVCGVSSILFFIAAITAHKNIKRKSTKKAGSSKNKRRK